MGQTIGVQGGALHLPTPVPGTVSGQGMAGFDYSIYVTVMVAIILSYPVS